MYSICVCISLAISAWWRAQRLCTKWLTVALAAGSDPPRGQNILALHKFLTRFQIADVSILFSAPAALHHQWDTPMTCSCTHAHPHNTHLLLQIRNTFSKPLAHWRPILQHYLFTRICWHIGNPDICVISEKQQLSSVLQKLAIHSNYVVLLWGVFSHINKNKQWGTCPLTNVCVNA